VLAVVAILLVVLPAVVAACPLCKDAKSDADYAGGTASLPSGFYYSILFMVTAPFVVLGALVLRIVLARRRLRSAADASSSAPVAPAPLLPDSRGARP
jgi:uncharacterized membrane protein